MPSSPRLLRCFKFAAMDPFVTTQPELDDSMMHCAYALRTGGMFGDNEIRKMIENGL